MYGTEQVGSIALELLDYFGASVVGLLVGLIIVLAIRNKPVAWTWLFVIPAITVIGLPTIHSSGPLIVGGVIATLIAALGMLFKSKSTAQDFGLRDAIKIKKVRWTVSAYLGYEAYVALTTSSVWVLLLTGGALVVMWWNPILRDFLHAYTDSNPPQSPSQGE